MGITAGEWFVGIIGFLGMLSSVVVAAMLSSAQGQRTAIWEAMAENRRNLSDYREELAELRGRCDAMFARVHHPAD